MGPAGAGKSSFARSRFLESEVLSTDWLRRVVSDDEADQTATPQAFAILRFILARRLKRGRLTVIDATNVRSRDRLALLRLAQRSNRPAVAVVFDLALDVCLRRNAGRVTRTVDASVVRLQWQRMPHASQTLLDEGFERVYMFTTPEEAERAVIVRES